MTEDDKKKEDAPEEKTQEPQDDAQLDVPAEPEQPSIEEAVPEPEPIPETPAVEPVPEPALVKEAPVEEPAIESPSKPEEEYIELPADDVPKAPAQEEPAPVKEVKEKSAPVEEVQEEPLPSEQIMMPLEEEPKTKEAKDDEEILLEKPGSAPEKPEPEEEELGEFTTHIFALRTTANREGQVLDFLSSNALKKELEVFSVIQPHGMRGYIFVEAASRSDAEQAAFRVPYARGILPNNLAYQDIEHMLEKSKKVEMNIRKNDIAEIISGPFKREKCKISRVDKQKEEVVVELLEAAVPIPITLKMDAIKVIRRDTEEGAEKK